MTNVIVGLGGNLGEPIVILKAALNKIKKLGSELKVSRFYSTKPISAIAQPRFINAVCRFKTNLDPHALFLKLEEIETTLGKVKKLKDAPRLIDLDILFYGCEIYEKEDLFIPHARWKERLFVLVPLLDLMEEVQVGAKTWNIKQMIEGIPPIEVKEVYHEACSD
jgi:2-amino-4-hydroxy-6-hydroxymethyldihydropteridine diphosphokinase